MNRRNFVKRSSLLGAGALILPNSMFAFNSSETKKVKLGFIAVGFRGQSHIAELLKRDDVEVIAIADPDNEMIDRTLSIFKKRNSKKPHLFLAKLE